MSLSANNDSFLRLSDAEDKAEDGSAILKRLPRLVQPGDSHGSYLSKQSGVVRLNTTALVDAKLTFRKVVDPIAVKKETKKAKEATAGRDWFDMPKTEMTPAIKRDLQLLKLRNVLDPKRHYRRDNEKLPEYFQPGTVVPGPTEYHSRLTKKERKQTLADEILADEKAKAYFRRKYDEIQAVKTSGGVNHYKHTKRRRRS